MNRRDHDKGEFATERDLVGFIRSIVSAPPENIIVPIGDDAAVIRPQKGCDVVFTVDSFISGVHFRPEWGTARDVGHRAMAGALSDIAAMAGRPTTAFVSVGLPDNPRREFIASLYRGFEDCALPFGCPVTGGETVSTPNDLVITICVLGSCQEGKAVTRRGASDGDQVYVTGNLGRNEAAVRYLEHGPGSGTLHERMKAVFHRPLPRIETALSLQQQCELTAMIDLSDGLSRDLANLARESRVGAVIDEASLPVSAEADEVAERLGHDPLDYALHGGEDYELLFTVGKPVAENVREDIERRFGVGITRVGTIRGTEIMVEKPDGSRVQLVNGGFDHLNRRKG